MSNCREFGFIYCMNRHTQAQEHPHATTKIRLIKLMNEQWTMKRFAYSLCDILLVMLGISAAFFWFWRFAFRFDSDCNTKHHSCFVSVLIKTNKNSSTEKSNGIYVWFRLFHLLFGRFPFVVIFLPEATVVYEAFIRVWDRSGEAHSRTKKIEMMTEKDEKNDRDRRDRVNTTKKTVETGKLGNGFFASSNWVCNVTSIPTMHNTDVIFRKLCVAWLHGYWLVFIWLDHITTIPTKKGKNGLKKGYRP